MMTGRVSYIVMALSILCLPAMTVQTIGATGDDWQFMIAPYMLFPNIKGEATVGRAGAAPFDVDSGDILDALDLGAMIHGELWYQTSGD